MTDFIDQVTFGDKVGYGYWDNGHHREHQTFINVLAGQTPPILLPSYDLLSLLTAGKEARKAQIEAHEAIHALLATVIGQTAVDFSGFDLDNDQDFYSFLGYHAQTHAQLRQALGVT